MSATAQEVQTKVGAFSRAFGGVLPGIALCLAVTVASMAVQRLEVTVFGHPYVEALVVAILLGILVRSVWQPGKTYQAGISFSAKMLLEIAVILLGASITMAAIIASGPALLIGVLLTVAAALLASYFLSRLLGLPQRMSILIACGNSICGNSAIVAVAPVIGASKDDIASAISFTAVLGVGIVVGLPFLIPLMQLSETQYGVLAGLTVYAVPQVLAATMPVSLAATQLGTLVKLCRVLMLAPVVIFFSLVRPKLDKVGPELGGRPSGLLKLIPWFVIGFIVFAILRSSGLIPTAAVAPITTIATFLTVLAMAALGLQVDIRVLGKVGGRVTTAVVLSLIVLTFISFGLIQYLHIT
jgi:uncharacterized integral membrane protein (TIGR00698 family)